MNKLNCIITIILICILIYLICKSKDNNNQKSIFIISIILLFLFCAYMFCNIEKLDNVEDVYDFDNYETKKLKVIKSINGLDEQIIKNIPVGFIYLTTNKDFDPNSKFGGTWESLANNKHNDLYLMLANDGENINYNNDMKCAFSKSVSDKCQAKNSFDLINNIEYVGDDTNKMRVYGGENQTQLNIYNVPPHTQYLTGADGMCQKNNRDLMCIDNQKLVGNATTQKSNNRYKRINGDNVGNVWTIQDANDRVKNKKKKIPEGENNWKNETVESHNNEPPFYIIYGWRKIKN